MTTPDSGAGAAAAPPEEIQAVPVRHPGRWIAAIIVAAISLVARSTRRRPTTASSGTSSATTCSTRRILSGLKVTLELTVLAMVIGIVLGVVLALMRLSPNGLLSTVSWVYIWLFRGTPVLVQILFWNFISARLPHDQPRDPVRPGHRPPEREHADHPVRRRDARPRA